MDEIAAYKNSKFPSSIVIGCSPPVNNIERGVNTAFNVGNNKVKTCYTANFFSAACFSDIIVINI
jgi:hypothetical protein